MLVSIFSAHCQKKNLSKGQQHFSLFSKQTKEQTNYSTDAQSIVQRHLDCIWICNWIKISNINKDSSLLLIRVVDKPNYSLKEVKWHFDSFYFLQGEYILIEFSVSWSSKNMVNKYHRVIYYRHLILNVCITCFSFEK